MRNEKQIDQFAFDPIAKEQSVHGFAPDVLGYTGSDFNKKYHLCHHTIKSLINICHLLIISYNVAKCKQKFEKKITKKTGKRDK